MWWNCRWSYLPNISQPECVLDSSKKKKEQNKSVFGRWNITKYLMSQEKEWNEKGPQAIESCTVTINVNKNTSRQRNEEKAIENIPANTAFYLPDVPSLDTLAEPPFLRLRTHTWHYGLASPFQAPSYSHMVCHILSRHEFLRLGCFLQSAEKHGRQDKRATDSVHKTDRQTDE